MQFHIDHTEIYGLERAIKASGNPMRTHIETTPIDEKDLKRAQMLGRTRGGEGHDNYLKGILVQMDVTAPLYWWKEAQRYHWFDFISSQSTMHSLLKFDLKERVVDEVDPRIISVVQTLIDEYRLIDDADVNAKKEKWRHIIASLPSGFCLSATMTTNYQQLKTMYFQRKHHKLIEWHIFCAWCEKLDRFSELIDLSNQ